MAILAVATESEDIRASYARSVSPVTAAASALGGYCRAYINATPNSAWEFKDDQSAQTELWFHARVQHTADGGGVANDTRIDLVSNANSQTAQFQVVRATTGQTWKIRKRDSGGTLVDIGTAFAVFTNPTVFNLDVGVLIHASTGYVKCYVNEILVMSFTGDTSTQHNVVDNVRCIPHRVSDVVNIAEAVLSSTSTVGLRVQSLAPTAAGNHSDWTGTFAAVDEVALNTSDFLTVATTVASHTLTFENTHADFAARTIKAVKLTGSVFTDGAITGIKPLVRNGATTNEGTTVTIATGTTNLGTLMLLNPVTAAAWTVAEVDGTELGYKTV